MKKACFFIILFCLTCSSYLAGQEAANYPLNITIVGTTKYQDTDFIIKNLKRSPQVEGLVISTSGRNLVELEGFYHGSRDSLIEEINGLAQDRFEMEVQKPGGKRSGEDLSVTLKKLPRP